MRAGTALRLTLTLAVSLGISLPPILGAAAPGSGEAHLRAAPPPSASARARVARWHRSWGEEAAALERSFRAASRAAERGDDELLRPRCVDLAGSLLALERPRVLPVPDRAADLHVRRALRHLARAAVACLTGRPFAARRSLDQAADAFGQARSILRRYRPPGNPEPTDRRRADPAGAVIASPVQPRGTEKQGGPS